MRRAWAAAVLVLAAGCGSPRTSEPPPPPLPPESPTTGAEPQVPVEVGKPMGPTFVAAQEGTEVVTGVRVLAPSLDAASATATFRLRNDTGRDLPDFLVSVVFSLPARGGGVSFRPQFETVECPLRSGETRDLRVTLARREGGTPTAFQVIVGAAEMLTAREGPGAPGTSFLSGRLECAGVEADLTVPEPRVTVRLRGTDGRPLPPLEAKLALVRAGERAWEGPWIVVPPPREGTGDREISWRLPGEPSLAGASPILRVRERR